METRPEAITGSVAVHHDRLDRFYRQLWGEHLHHGFWTDSALSPEKAVRGLVLCTWMTSPDASQWAREWLLNPICEEGRLWGLPTASDVFR